MTCQPRPAARAATGRGRDAIGATGKERTKTKRIKNISKIEKESVAPFVRGGGATLDAVTLRRRMWGATGDGGDLRQAVRPAPATATARWDLWDLGEKIYGHLRPQRAAAGRGGGAASEAFELERRGGEVCAAAASGEQRAALLPAVRGARCELASWRGGWRAGGLASWTC